MAKFTLDIEYDFNFILFAISSHEPDYKLCIAMNRALGLDFTREEPIELKNKKQEDQLLFSFFYYEDEEKYIEYNLVSNKSYNSSKTTEVKKMNQPSLFGETDPAAMEQKAYLVPELASADFLFIVRTDYEPDLVTFIENKLKQIPFVLNVSIVDVNDLPSKKNLIF